ncbi:MAG: PQQ-binding-like beta-propeller repeat protein [Pirellulaceae bacterium]|nr:PQQ-binding-like beta-propeller repeat protein [Pirellulaceae bacterium]
MCMGWSLAVDPLDWPNWRGPEYSGTSREKNLPESWSPSGENLLWRKEEYATRATPIVMHGKLFTVCRAFPETTREGEKVICADAATGELIWESIHNVFLSDAPAERVGWSSVCGDPQTGKVYVLGLGSHFQCLDGKDGKVLWEHSMSEQYGMLSTYGGRTNFPVVFEDLVIISGVMTGWGEYAVPAHRFVAFDKNSGQAVWMLSTRLRPEDTTYSSPSFAVLNGQQVMVFGGGDGSIYAVQPRTGKVVWTYDASTRGLNTSPLVVDGIVYSSHAEQNASDTTTLGAIFAFDGRTEGKIAEEQLLWKLPGKAVGRSSPVYADGRLYIVEDGGTLLVVDAKQGKVLQSLKVGRIIFGSPLLADGKLYVAENTGRVHIYKLTEKGLELLQLVRLNGEEIFGSPIASHGRVYIPTTTALYCIGAKDHQPSADPIPAGEPERDAADDQKLAHIQLSPVEIMLEPGKSIDLQVRGYNSRGQFLKVVPAQLSVAGPGTIKGLTYSAPTGAAHQVATITAKVGELTSVARARLIPPLPWRFDFDDQKVPPTWIGASYRHQPKEFDGQQTLVKITTIPKGTRSQSWMGWTNLSNYTVMADFYATERNEKRPSMGLIAQRYTLDMTNKQELQIRSWTSRLELRFAKTIPFEWSTNTWYSMKFQAANESGQAVLRGKVWQRGHPEPQAWTIEATDATPNTMGSPGMFGNASDAEFYIDNVRVEPNS